MHGDPYLFCSNGADGFALAEVSDEGWDESTGKEKNDDIAIPPCHIIWYACLYSLGKLVAEVDEVFSGGGQGVPQLRYGVANVRGYGGHVRTGVAHRVHILPRDLHDKSHACHMHVTCMSHVSLPSKPTPPLP